MNEIELQLPMLHHKMEALDFKNEFFERNEQIIPGSALLDRMEFDDWLVHNTNNRHESTVIAGWVVATTFFAVRKSDRKIVGMIDVRLSLGNDFLALYGGHIGYSIRPGERRKGYATILLKMALEYAKIADIKKVMISCFEDNIPSIKTIEKCGGKLAETKLYQTNTLIHLPDAEDKLLNIYWIDLEEACLVEMSDFFNYRATIYDEKHVEHIGGGLESKHVIATFFPPHTQTMIDLGIGTGLELEGIYKRFPEIEVTGLDIAECMLEQLLKKYPDKNIRLYRESYLKYDLGISLYDAAISVMTLHHYNRQTKTALYRKIYNSLKMNGVYVECDYMISERQYENPQVEEDLNFATFERLKKEQGITDDVEYHYDTPCTVSNQKKMLSEAGFSSVKEVWSNGNTIILVAEK